MEWIWTNSGRWMAGDVRQLCAEGLAEGLDLVEAIKSMEILDLMQLSGVPCNGRLVKGVLEGPSMSIPLMDARVNLSAEHPGGIQGQERACAMIVNVKGLEVGLIVGPAFQA